MQTPVVFPLTVYYDAACPLCASEMHTLRDRAPAGSFVLVDCSAPDFDDASFAHDGVTRAMMLKRIHARDAQGRWLNGLDVFEAAYSAAALPALARIFARRQSRPLLDRVYQWIADHRHGLSRARLHYLFRLVPRGRDAGKSACATRAEAADRRQAMRAGTDHSDG